MTIFDKTKEYKKFILPIVDELRRQCEMFDMPMFVSCCVKSEDNATTYKRDGVCTGSHNISLFDDQIEKHLLVANGFPVTLPGFEGNLPENFMDYIAQAEAEMPEDEEFLVEEDDDSSLEDR